ncbi:MAG: DNRLRE domain-containing protein [Saprospiraceae bacterium]
MKLLLSYFLCFSIVVAQAQTTLIFQPNSDCTKDAFINNSPVWNGGPGFDVNNYGTQPYLRIEAWTANSNGSPEHDSRSLIDFPELHEIESCDVLQATLVLYANPNITFANGGQAETNDVDIFRITEPWEELEVTWLTQPDFDENLKAEIPQNNNYDSIVVDVTELVTKMIEIENSFGFFLKQKNENPYGSMDFASSQYSDSTKAPKLILEANNIVYTEPIAEIFPSSDTTLCTGLGLILNVQNDLANSYEWQDGSTGSAFGTTTEGTYSVTINYNNCVTMTDTINVFFQDLIYSQGAFSTPDTSGCISQPITLDVQNAEAVSYLWSNGSTNSSIDVTDAGVYSVNIVLENCLGLEGSINVNFEECNFDCEVKIPNAFTPDGDLLNDAYLPFAETVGCFEEYEITIFNRWGNQVFKSKDPSIGWDGKFNNKNASSDVYIYLLKYQTVNDSELQVKNGDLTLIR